MKRFNRVLSLFAAMCLIALAGHSSSATAWFLICGAAALLFSREYFR